ncbi:MAG: ACP S-malonyltransferase [Candidatus Kaelpia imicola]|nr:ACP S-malonyltransferase [Candidatus Kaelpia imicola]
MKLGYIFPGQGSQYIGMGHDLYEHFDLAKEMFHEANNMLGFDIMRLCFFGPIEELTKTKNCQPAVFLVSVVTLRCLEEYFFTKESGGLIKPAITAGLSLGEYASLVAASSISFEDGLLLTRRRGEFMEEASKENEGQMSAIIGLDRDILEEIAGNTGAEIANINSPNQIVIAGSPGVIKKAETMALDRGAKRVMRLNVSGAFHSSLMEPAARKLMLYLKDLTVLKPEITVLSNVNAYYSFFPQEIKANLINQVNRTTLWLDCVKVMIDSGLTSFLEIGCGKRLKGLLRKIDPNLIVYNIENYNDIENLYQELILEEVNHGYAG